MAGGGGEGTSRQLDQTPTWAVAGVCAVIILISIALEKIIHKLGTWLTDRHKKALFEALEKVKAELMVLGFISLTLVFSQYYIAGICIPTSVANTLLPCPAMNNDDKTEEHRRRLLWHERRILAGAEPRCDAGVSLISVDALHQIHILIFFLAVLHVVYGAMTMWLGKLKVTQSILFISSCIILELLCHLCGTFWNIKRNFSRDPLFALYFLVVSLVHTLSPSKNSDDPTNLDKRSILYWYNVETAIPKAKDIFNADQHHALKREERYAACLRLLKGSFSYLLTTY